MRKSKTALIAGASGLVGRELLLLLLDSPDYHSVISLVRIKTSYQHAKLTQVVADFNDLDKLSEHFVNADDVFCCLGTTMKNAGSKEAFRRVDFDYPVAMAILAEKNNCRGFYCVSSMGASTTSRVYYSRIKGQLEERISSMNISSIWFFRPSLLAGYREEFRLGERIALAFFKALAFIYWGPMKNLKVIPAKKVASAMIEAASKDEKGVHIISSGSMQ